MRIVDVDGRKALVLPKLPSFPWRIRIERVDNTPTTPATDYGEWEQVDPTADWIFRRRKPQA